MARPASDSLRPAAVVDVRKKEGFGEEAEDEMRGKTKQTRECLEFYDESLTSVAKNFAFRSPEGEIL